MPFTPAKPVASATPPAAPKGFTPAGKPGAAPADPRGEHATAMLGASTAILSAIHGVTQDAAERTGDVYAQGAADITGDLNKNAEVQKSGASLPVKAGSEVMAGANVAGDFAKTVFAPFTGAIGTLVDKLSNTPGMQDLAKTGPVGAVLDAANKNSAKVNEWAAANPDKAKAVSDFFNVAGLALGAAGDTTDVAAAARDAGGAARGMAGKIPGVVQKAASVDRTASAAAGKAADTIATRARALVSGPKIDPVEEALSPRLTAKVAESEGGTAPQGIMGNIQRVISSNAKRMSDTVKEAVPGFDKLKTWTEKANAVEAANTTEAQALEDTVAANDHPYTFRELNATIRNLEKPELIKSGDPTVTRLFDSARSKMLSLARENGGTMSGLLKSRKKFYTWVNKEYKNLWGSDQITAAREGVSAIAQGVNKFIADGVDAAEPGAGAEFLGSLKTQSNLFDAEDVLREKAARGNPSQQGEIGTSRFGRFAASHPTATKIGETAAGAVIGGEALKKLGIIP